MIIGHVNLAAGFRGGERQTELLIRELSMRGYTQVLIVRSNSALADRLHDIPNLTICRISKPYVFHVSAARDCSFLHAHEAKACQYTFLVKVLLRIPYVITRRVPRIPGSNFFTKAIYNNASRIVALSGAIKKSLLLYNRNLSIDIIPSMASQLETNNNTVQEIKNNHSDRFIVGHVGALVNRHKGQKYLIEAAKILADKYNDIDFILLGSGGDERELMQLANGYDNIQFKGFVDNVGDYLGAFDLFAFPSLNEGLGSILLDAMQAKLPIVASEVDGIPDIISNGHNGMLVSPADSQALAEAISMLYENEKLRKSLAENAYGDAKKYTPERITSMYINNIYTGITP